MKRKRSGTAKLRRYMEQVPQECKYTVGLDISLNSPGMTVIGPNGTKCYSWMQRKREVRFQYAGEFCDITVFPFNLHDPRNVKIRNIVKGIRQVLDDLPTDDTAIYMEDLAYGAVSTGSSSLTQLAGISEVIKFVLDDIGFNPPYLVSPPTLKKMFSGDGRSKKSDMYRAWLEHGGPDLCRLFLVKRADQKPVEDIVDSYALARFRKDLCIKLAESTESTD